MVSPTLAIIIVLVLYVILYAIGRNKNIPYLADIFIFIYFLFAFINIEGSATLATFYLFAIIFVIAFEVAQSKFTVNSQQIKEIGGFKLKSKLPLIGIGLGFGILLIMRVLQTSVEGSIIGVPSLAITSPAFGVSTITLLGIVENRLFFTIYELLKANTQLLLAIPFIGGLLGIFNLILPVVLTAILFAIFHLTAYSLSVSTMIFAALVMVIWLLSYILTKSDLPANLAHGMWNGTIALGRVLGVAV